MKNIKELINNSLKKILWNKKTISFFITFLFSVKVMSKLFKINC